MATIVTDTMDAHASEAMIMGLVSRLEREGQYLTPSQVGRIHYIITQSLPDMRSEGNQKELTELIRDRVIRDDR